MSHYSDKENHDERVKREARNEALRAAAEKADKKCCSKGQFALAQACKDAILALMEDTDDDQAP